jgi:hypothetical protein
MTHTRKYRMTSKKSHMRKRQTRKRSIGGRGGMGGAELGHSFTSGASQELYQLNGKTPGLSSGGSRRLKRK